MLNQFSNLSCYEEFEIQCTLTGISKINILRKIGHKINNYYFFISEDGIFNWFDLEGNHVKDPRILKELKLKNYYIPRNMTKCIIPNSVTSICAWTFSRCESLKEITIPNNVTCIGYEAFYGCKSLTSITIPNSITCISTRVFSYCELLKEITIPDSVTSIDECAFFRCYSLKSINIPNSVTSIGCEAFAYCNSLEEIIIPDTVTSIDDDTFYDCISLKEVIFKGKTLDEVKQMDNYPFGINRDQTYWHCSND